MENRHNHVTPVLDLGYRTFIIKDFEIFGTTVYFCGLITTQFPAKAVFGTFKLSDFQYGNVTYAEFDDYISFDKLEILAMDRFLLIGKSVNSEYHFIEVQQTYAPLSWSMYIYDQVAEYVDRLDDVAGNSQYAVFTGRNTSQNKGYIFFADYASAGWLASPQPIQMLTYAYDVTSPLLLEYCESGVFATVALGDDSLLSISTFSGPTHFTTRQAISGYDITDVCDLKYKKNQQRLDVLTHHSDYELYYSRIFHFEPTFIYYTTSTVTGRQASDYWLSSLEESPVYVPGGLNLMLSTGFNYYGNLTLHRYSSTSFNCWEKVEMKVQEIDKEPKETELSFERKRLNVLLYYPSTTTYTLETNTICY